VQGESMVHKVRSLRLWRKRVGLNPDKSFTFHKSAQHVLRYPEYFQGKETLR
jgi:hypothetical protein